MVWMKRAAACAVLVFTAASLSAAPPEPSGVGAVDLAWKKAVIANDLEAIADGYVSVTPLHLDLTHEASLDGLHKKFAATP